MKYASINSALIGSLKRLQRQAGLTKIVAQKMLSHNKNNKQKNIFVA